MKIELNIGNKQAAFFLASFAVVLVIGLAVAYNDPPVGGDPAVVGHSVDELKLDPLHIDPVSERVGIGTASPRNCAKLEVNTTGNKSIYTMDSANGGLLIGYQGSNIQGRTTSHANSDLILNLWGGNVGIGTTDPKASLHINSTLKLEPTNNPGTCNAEREGMIYYDTTSKKLYFCDRTDWQEIGIGAGPEPPATYEVDGFGCPSTDIPISYRTSSRTCGDSECHRCTTGSHGWEVNGNYRETCSCTRKSGMHCLTCSCGANPYTLCQVAG